MTHRYINPPTLAHPTGYTHVVEATGARTVYISGQVALDSSGNIVGLGDMRAQAQQVFENLHSALQAVGAGFRDVVKLTYFVVDMTQLPVVREVRDQFIHPEQLPASTAVEIRRLAREEFLLEVEAIAALGS
ncbi:MAG TPA: RidA family protein [Ktedonobacterales bacterium]|nr:RidA family protein [Ktedonobacterales bacterium]